MGRFVIRTRTHHIFALGCLSLLVLGVVTSPVVQAQVLYGSLVGHVEDSSGASVPGATVTISNKATNQSRALTFHVNGACRSSNNTRIDGVTGTNVWLPHMTSYIPALESIETVNVVTNSFDAEQGLAGGAAVNVLIKSGTNQLHGSAFEYHNDNALKARPYFTPVNQRNPKQVYNQFGGTVGGPIKRDKLFYFVSYEGTMDHQFAARTQSVPTLAMKAGDFSASA